MPGVWQFDPFDAVGRLEVGGGRVGREDGRWRLYLPPGVRGRYVDAQIHDYAGLHRRDYPWRPPLALSVRARLSPHVHGTAGFGFWNNPFPAPGGLPALPQAAWFLFASPPNDLQLAQNVPGHGWKAATLDSGRRQALVWAPLAPLVLLLCRRQTWRRRLWPRVQRALALDEVLIGDPATWHTYDIIWLRSQVVFGVDGREVLRTTQAPRGPLGLVIWIDNQWARVTPRGSFGWGLLDTADEQWLEFENLRIVSASYGQ